MKILSVGFFAEILFCQNSVLVCFLVKHFFGRFFWRNMFMLGFLAVGFSVGFLLDISVQKVLCAVGFYTYRSCKIRPIIHI